MDRGSFPLVGLGMVIGILPIFVGRALVPTRTVFALSVLALIGGVLLIRPRVTMPLVVLLGFAVRIPYAVFAPIHDDSGVYYAIANQLAEGTFVFTGHIGVELVMAAFVLFFGQAGANLASFTASLATIPIVGATAAQLFSSRRAGIAAATAMALTPLHVYFSSWAYTEPIAICFFSLALYMAVSDRYAWAGALTAVTALMRLEYAVLILVPLLVFRLSKRSSIKYATVIAPVLGVATVSILAMLVPEDGLSQVVSLLSNSSLYSTTFLVQFAQDPVTRLSSNILFYTSHFLHWGVPYWGILLVNPLLPALFLVGTYTLLPRIRLTSVALTFAPGTVYIAFVTRESVGVTAALISLAVIALVTVGLVLLLAAGPISQPEIQPLFALVPYAMLLLVLYRAPRYLLPVAVIGCLYVGLGFVRLYDEVTDDEPWTIRVRSPI